MLKKKRKCQYNRLKYKLLGKTMRKRNFLSLKNKICKDMLTMITIKGIDVNMDIKCIWNTSDLNGSCKNN